MVAARSVVNFGELLKVAVSKACHRLDRFVPVPTVRIFLRTFLFSYRQGYMVIAFSYSSL
jgi:hypothetical protein